jgi:ribonuclease HI
MPVDERIKKCHQVQHIDLNTCHNLVQAIDTLDKEQHFIWRNADEIKVVSESLWEKLDKAYNKVGDARDWLREIIGDVD